MPTAKLHIIIAALSFTSLLAACGTTSPNQSASGASKHTSVKHSGSSAKKSGGHKSGSGTHKHVLGSKPHKKGRRIAASKPSRSRKRTALATKTINLSTLPTMTSVRPFNPHLKDYHEVSTFITDMGYHWTTQVPGMVFMTNQDNQITAVESMFPQNLGSYSWYDPATPPTVLNASLAFYSEHLYFVPPTTITPSMSPTESTALSSWTAFVANNPRLKVYVKEPSPFHGYTVYGPPNGPGIQVLVSPSGPVSGFMVAEPASWGYNPVYVTNKGKPFTTKIFTKAYYSVFMLEPVSAPSATT